MPSLKGDQEVYELVVGQDSIVSSAGGVVTEWAIPDPKANTGEAEPRSSVSLMYSEALGECPTITAMQVCY